MSQFCCLTCLGSSGCLWQAGAGTAWQGWTGDVVVMAAEKMPQTEVKS